MQTQAAVQAPKIRSEWPGLPGSKYAGIAAGENDQPDYHLVLLADKAPRELNWNDSIAWAEKLGAAVPSRDESALLYAHLRDEFEGGWHWTSTQYSSGNAWYQDFSYGDQSYRYKKAEARCRAVRRIPQSFNPSILPEAAASAPKVEATTNALLSQVRDEVAGLRSDMRAIFMVDTGVTA